MSVTANSKDDNKWRLIFFQQMPEKAKAASMILLKWRRVEEWKTNNKSEKE